ncbi:hypothetical protein PG984_002482 [Apiospora sp. TS-2023a]
MNKIPTAANRPLAVTALLLAALTGTLVGLASPVVAGPLGVAAAEPEPPTVPLYGPPPAPPEGWLLAVTVAQPASGGRALTGRPSTGRPGTSGRRAPVSAGGPGAVGGWVRAPVHRRGDGAVDGPSDGGVGFRSTSSIGRGRRAVGAGGGSSARGRPRRAVVPADGVGAGAVGAGGLSRREVGAGGGGGRGGPGAAHDGGHGLGLGALVRGPGVFLSVGLLEDALLGEGILVSKLGQL